MTIMADTTYTVDITLPDTGTLQVTVDDGSDPIPAKVSVVGFDPSPAPPIDQDLAGVVVNKTSYFRDRRDVQGSRYDLISGVSNDIPIIESYSDTSVEIIATVDWINGLRLLQSLIARPGSSMSYKLDAKLDPGLLLPAFHIIERGIIDLAQEP